MMHSIQKELVELCERIVDENKSLDDWSLVESSDMFQHGSYNGGFDAIEMEFCFSFYDSEGMEYWFQVSLEDVIRIANAEKTTIQMRKAEV